MKVDVGPVLEAGREVELDVKVPLPECGAFVFEEPAHVVLTLNRVGSGLAIDGFIEAAYSGECERCLGPVHRALHLTVDERLVAPVAWGKEEAEPLSDANVLSGTKLDLDDLTRQLVIAALPLVNLCSDDCAGLCSGCGQHTGACTCGRMERNGELKMEDSAF